MSDLKIIYYRAECNNKIGIEINIDYSREVFPT